MSTLLYCLSPNMRSFKTRAKAVYALSSVSKHCVPALKQLEEADGWNVLKSALQGPEPNWSSERMITSESAWAAWRGLGGTRAAVRKGSYLYLLDDPEALYNTLTDNVEASPLPFGDERSYQIRMHLSEYLRSLHYQSWQPPERVIFEKLNLARDLWRRRGR